MNTRSTTRSKREVRNRDEKKMRTNLKIQKRGDEGPNLFVDFLDGGGGIDHADTFGFASRNRFETVFDALEKLAVEFFHAVALLRLPNFAARLAHVDRHVKENCEIGTRVADRKRNHAADGLEVEPAAVTLIGDRGVVEPVAENDFARAQGRTNNFAHELGAAGVHEQ